eukprot:4747344-Pyramimonas_sp.AAC.1
MCEFSHAAQVSTSPGIAPGTQATLDQLRLWPASPADPLPPNLKQCAPARQLSLDRGVFAIVLRQPRKG